MEIFSFKKPGIYVFGWALVIVSAVFFFAGAHVAYAQTPINILDCQKAGGIWNEDESAGTANCVISTNTANTSVNSGPEYQEAQVVNGVRTCPNGYTLMTGGAAPICQRNDLSGPGTASAGNVFANTVGTNKTASASGGETFSCSSISDFFTNLGLCTIWGIGKVLNYILSFGVVLTSKFLDFAIQTNLDIKTQVDNIGGINSLWQTMRDLANILFIFFLLWISIETILGLGNAKNALPGIIIAALLINFSMFFTKVIIDVSNISALQFYTAIKASGTGNNETIGTALLRGMELQGIYDPGYTSGLVNKEPTSKTDLITVIVFGNIVLLIALYAFLIVSFLMLARIVILFLLIATSPIGFISSVLPKKMQEYYNMWWNEIWNQALVMPVFMLMMWATLKIVFTLNGGQLSGTGKSGAFFNSFVPGKLDFITSSKPIFNFLLLIGLLIATVKITKKLSGAGGAMITGLGASAIGMVAGGGVGFLGRNTLGAVGKWAAGNKRLQDLASTSAIGRTALRAAEGASKSSWDIRGGIPLVGGVAGKVLKQAGADLDFGNVPKGAQKGYAGQVEASAKSRAEFEKKLDQKYDFRSARTNIESKIAEARTGGASEDSIKSMRKDMETAMFKEAAAVDTQSKARKDTYWQNMAIRKPTTLWMMSAGRKEAIRKKTEDKFKEEDKKRKAKEKRDKKKEKDEEIKNIEGQLNLARGSNDTALINEWEEKLKKARAEQEELKDEIETDKLSDTVKKAVEDGSKSSTKPEEESKPSGDKK